MTKREIGSNALEKKMDKIMAYISNAKLLRQFIKAKTNCRRRLELRKNLRNIDVPYLWVQTFWKRKRRN